MPQRDKIGTLYDAVSQQYDIGDESTFRSKLSDPAKRKAFYDGVGQQYELGTFDEFSNKIAGPVPEKKNGLLPVTPPASKTPQFGYGTAVEAVANGAQKTSTLNSPLPLESVPVANPKEISAAAVKTQGSQTPQDFIPQTPVLEIPKESRVQKYQKALDINVQKANDIRTEIEQKAQSEQLSDEDYKTLIGEFTDAQNKAEYFNQAIQGNRKLELANAEDKNRFVDVGLNELGSLLSNNNSFLARLYAKAHPEQMGNVEAIKAWSDKKAKAQGDKAQYYRELLDEVAGYNGKDISDIYKEKGIAGAIEYGAKKFTESAPLTAYIAGMSAVGLAPLANTQIFGGTFEQKYRENEGRTDMSEKQKVAQALGYGTTELLFEGVLTSGITSLAKDYIKQFGKEEAKKQLKRTMYDMVKDGLKKTTPLNEVLLEGLGGGLTQLSQNIIDKNTDPNLKDKDVMDGVVDATAIEAIGGVGFAATTVAGALINQGANKKKLDDLEIKKQNIQNGLNQVSPETAQVLEQEVAKIQEQQNDIIIQDRNVLSNDMSDEKREQVKNLSETVDAMTGDMNNTQDENLKKILQDKIEQTQNTIDEIYKEAEAAKVKNESKSADTGVPSSTEPTKPIYREDLNAIKARLHSEGKITFDKSLLLGGKKAKMKVLAPTGKESILHRDLTEIYGEEEGLRQWDRMYSPKFKKEVGDLSNPIIQSYTNKLGAPEIGYMSHNDKVRGDMSTVRDEVPIWARGNKIMINSDIFNPELSNIFTDYINKSVFAHRKDKKDMLAIFKNNRPAFERFLIYTIMPAMERRAQGESFQPTNREAEAAWDQVKKELDNGFLLDENGEPHIFMHAGAKGIKRFRKPGDKGAVKNDNLTGQEGIYFSRDLEQADKYANAKGDKIGEGKDIYYSLLKIKNPYFVENPISESIYKLPNGSETISSEDRKALEKAGFDGIVWGTKKSPYHEVIVFEPDQIKTIETFSGEKPNANEKSNPSTPNDNGGSTEGVPTKYYEYISKTDYGTISGVRPLLEILKTEKNIKYFDLGNDIISVIIDNGKIAIFIDKKYPINGRFLAEKGFGKNGVFVPPNYKNVEMSAKANGFDATERIKRLNTATDILNEKYAELETRKTDTKGDIAEPGTGLKPAQESPIKEEIVSNDNTETNGKNENKTQKTEGDVLEITPEQKAKFEANNQKAQELGFVSAPAAINSVAKRTGVKYDNFEDIPPNVLNKVAEERGKEKESGRSKTYQEKRVPINKAYNDLVNENKVSYQQMDLKENADQAVEYLKEFGDNVEGYERAHEDLMAAFATNPYASPTNGVAAELLADKLFFESENARMDGDTKKQEELLNKSNSLRAAAFNAATKAGQYNAALAVFSRAVNPEAFLLFVNRQIEQEYNDPNNGNKRKTITRKVTETASEINKAKKEAAEETVSGVPKKEGTKRKLSDLRDRGLKRQKDALAKLRKMGYLGSSGLNNEAIEAVGELILSQIELGVYKLAKITERIKSLTDGKITDDHIKEAFEKYTANLDGKELTLDKATEQLQSEREKELTKKRFSKDAEKELERKAAEDLKGNISLKDLIKKNLEAGATAEAMASEMIESLGLPATEAKNIADKYADIYKRKLAEKINKTLEKELGIRAIKKVNEQENAGEIKPYEKTLGGKIVNQILAGALDNETLNHAFSVKYGLPVLSPTVQNNIRLLSQRAKAATTPSSQLKANKNLLSYIHQQMPTSISSVLNTAYYISLLSGISTAAVNLFGNANMLLNQRFENGIVSIIEAAQGNKANLASTFQTKQKIKNALNSIYQGVTNLADIMQHGGGESKYYTLNQKGLGNFDAERLVVKGKDFKGLTLGKTLKTLAKLFYTAPAVITRNLDASDLAFQALNFNMEAVREVRKDLYNDGLRGSDLETVVAEKVYGTKQIQQNAIKDAEIEAAKIGLDPAKNKKFVKRVSFEMIQARLDDRVQNIAREQARENVFKGAHRGMTGYLSSMIPQITLVTPFKNAVMKIAEMSIRALPLYGIARYSGLGVTDVARKLSPSINKAFEQKGIEKTKREGAARNKQLAQILLVHTLYATFYALTKIAWYDPDDGEDKPLLEVSGGYVGMSYEEREKAKKIMPEYTLRFMGISINYESNPLLAMICLPISVGMDKARVGKESEPIENMAQYATIALPVFLMNQTPLQNLAEFFKSTRDAFDTDRETDWEAYGKNLLKHVAVIPANIVAPNTYKQAFDISDPKKYNAITLEEVLWKAFNMERIGGLHVKYDRWGREEQFYPGESKFPLSYWLDGADAYEVDKWEIENKVHLPEINLKTLVLDMNGENKSYTLKRWQEKQNAVDEYRNEMSKEGLEIENELEYKMLTPQEWQDMDQKVRNDVYNVVKDNFNRVVDQTETPDGELLIPMPFSKMDAKTAQTEVDFWFRQKRLDYIRVHWGIDNEE